MHTLMGYSLENEIIQIIPPWRRGGQYGSLGPERGRVEMRTWFRIFLFDFAPRWKQSLRIWPAPAEQQSRPARN